MVLEIATVALERNKARQELKMATVGLHETEGRALVPLRAAIRRAEELNLSAEVLEPARSALAEEERRSEAMAAELAAATAGDDPEMLRAALRRCAEAGPHPHGTLERRIARARAALRRLLALQLASPVKSPDTKATKPLESRRASKRPRPSDDKVAASFGERAVSARLECAREPGLRVEPCHGICFGTSPSSELQTLRPLQLTNTSCNRIAFKVKLICREFYLVLPRCCGTLLPREVMSLQVALKPNWREMPPGSRRLVVHEMQVGPEEEIPRNAWSYMRERTMEHKIRILLGEEEGLQRQSLSLGHVPDNLD